MTTNQKITDTPINFAEDIIANVKKNTKDDGVLKCVQCGLHTSTCPAARHSEYNPREIIERVLEGDETIIAEDYLWNCFYCYTCHSVCPVGNRVCEVNQILKQFAIKVHSVNRVRPSHIKHAFDNGTDGIFIGEFPGDLIYDEVKRKIERVKAQIEKVNENPNRLAFSKVYIPYFKALPKN